MRAIRHAFGTGRHPPGAPRGLVERKARRTVLSNVVRIIVIIVLALVLWWLVVTLARSVANGAELPEPAPRIAPTSATTLAPEAHRFG